MARRRIDIDPSRGISAWIHEAANAEGSGFDDGGYDGLGVFSPFWQDRGLRLGQGYDDLEAFSLEETSGPSLTATRNKPPPH